MDLLHTIQPDDRRGRKHLPPLLKEALESGSTRQRERERERERKREKDRERGECVCEIEREGDIVSKREINREQEEKTLIYL